MELYKEFSFEAAHHLPNVAHSHKCRRLHGHSFRVTLHVDGPLDPLLGWVIDFAEIKQVMAPALEILDHNYLNEIEGLENPTSENIARWIWNRIHAQLPMLSKIVVSETCTSGCVYRGD